jgi:hypothetical protein
MGAVFGLLVAGEEVLAGVPVGLVDHLAVGIAEHTHRRDVDDARHARIDRRVQDPLGTPHVRIPHVLTLRGGDADLVDRRDVEHGIAALHPVTDRLLGGQVALDQLDALLPQVFRLRG